MLTLEWLVGRRRAASGGYSARLRLGGIALVLLLLSAVAGTVSGLASQGHVFSEDVTPELASAPKALLSFFGEKRVSQASEDFELEPGSTLMIHNPYGKVTVRGHSPDSKLHIDATISSTVWPQKSAHAAEPVHLGSLFHTDAKAALIEAPNQPGTTYDLSVSVPDALELTLRADRGDVSVSAVKAAVHIAASHGDVDLNNIVGTIDCQMSDNDASLSADHIDGHLALTGRAQDLSVIDLTQGLGLTGDFFGDTHLERIDGGLDFLTSRTHLTTDQSLGVLDLSAEGELDADGIAGHTSLTTRSRNVDLKHVAGWLQVDDRDGSVDVSTTLPLRQLKIRNADGSIDLTLPPSQGVSLRAETRDGEITSDFGPSPEKLGDVARLVASSGTADADIVLSTSNEDINVHLSGS